MIENYSLLAAMNTTRTPNTSELKGFLDNIGFKVQFGYMDPTVLSTKMIINGLTI